MPRPGETVRVHYICKLEDGTEFENTFKKGTPLEFALGNGRMIPAFEGAILTMLPGETKTLRLTACQAYGERRDDLVESVPIANVPGIQQAEVGARVLVGTPGQLITARVLFMDDKTVKLDLNHELAGHDLVYEITYLGTVEESLYDEEIEHGGECACGCDKLKVQLEPCACGHEH